MESLFCAYVFFFCYYQKTEYLGATQIVLWTPHNQITSQFEETLKVI